MTNLERLQGTHIVAKQQPHQPAAELHRKHGNYAQLIKPIKILINKDTKEQSASHLKRKTLLRLLPRLPLVLEMVPLVGGSVGVHMTTSGRTTLTCKKADKVSPPCGPLWARFVDKAPHQTKNHLGHPL